MASSVIPHLLILEPDARGHVREWIEHLIACARTAAPVPVRLSIAVPHRLAQEIEPALPSQTRGDINVIPLSPRETELCLHRKLWISGMARWWTMRRCLVRTGATHGLFLALDHLSLPLALGLGAHGRPLSGILFRPSVHYGEIGPYRPTLRERVRDLRKVFLYRLMLRNPSLVSVLSLDPYFVDYAQSRYPNADKVVDTPDPVCPAPAPSTAEAELANAVPENRRLLLLFGELTARKGILTLLDALSLLSAEDASRIAVIAAGRVDPPIHDAVHDSVLRLHRERPELWLRLVDRRLTTGEISAFLHRSHTVLAPYHRFVGSSGILLWAAHAKRPVLCQDYGLLGRLTREYHLGTTVDSTNAPLLAQKIRSLAYATDPEMIDEEAMERLCAARDPSRFARIVLSHAIRNDNETAAERWFDGDTNRVLD